MATRRYRYSWDQLAVLDCDHMAKWGAFEPSRVETVEFDNETVSQIAFKMAGDGQSFSVAYQWPLHDRSRSAEYTQSRVELARRPCRFGGTRAYFTCPCCGRKTLRLAVLPDGLRCGMCGRITWESRRQRPLQRLMRKADKIAWQLGCDSWQDVPQTKPLHMHLTTFEVLKAQHAALASEINREINCRLARTKGGLLAQLAALARIER